MFKVIISETYRTLKLLMDQFQDFEISRFRDFEISKSDFDLQLTQIVGLRQPSNRRPDNKFPFLKSKSIKY